LLRAIQLFLAIIWGQPISELFPRARNFRGIPDFRTILYCQGVPGTPIIAPMSDLSDLLNKGFLSDAEGVSSETRALLASESFSEILVFPEDIFITQQGKQPDALYFTLDGLFHAISHANRDAPQRLLGRIEGGQFIGEVSLVDSESKASASVKALRNSRALRMTREALDAFCENHPAHAIEFVMAVAKQLGRRLRQANEKVL